LFGFAALAGARIVLGQMYASTEGPKRVSIFGNIFRSVTTSPTVKTTSAKPIVSAGSDRLSNPDAEAAKYGEKIKSVRRSIAAAAANPDDTEGKAFGELNEDVQKDYLDIHVSYMEQLAFIVKGVGLALVLILAINFVVYQLVVENKTLIEMVAAFLIAYIVTAVFFTAASFKRLFITMGTSFLEMPLFKGLTSITGSDWFKALVLLIAGPILPGILVLSAINQCVRVKRKLYGAAGTMPADSGGEYIVQYQPSPLGGMQDVKLKCPAERLRLTLRVHIFIQKAFDWNWVSILSKMYLLGVAFAIYSVAPLSIEILLGWFVKVLNNFDLVPIIVSVWMVGLVLFLLPPVPGAPVYLFGGILVTRKAQEIEFLGTRDSGFWAGACISIFVCWILKLSACAMQQKGIGGLLGTQLWVQQTVGVHKPTIRAIEMILRVPGLSFGKVMILCGGPDWPTSVLCGLLKLSLLSCEVGTTPIIFYIAPFSLSGSFLLRRNDGAIWENASNLMLLITIVMTVVYWAACAWVIQNTFNEHHDELSKKLISNVDLDWLDERELMIAERTGVTLSEAPCIVKVVYVGGALVMLGTCHAFQWIFTSLFGTYKMTENDIDELRWLETDARIIKPAGLAVIVALVASLFGKVLFDMWKKKWTRSARLGAVTEADAMESAWKEREREAREGAGVEATAPQQGSYSVPAMVEQENDDPERTPETYVPPAENNKVTGQSSQAKAQGARPQSLGKPTDKPKASTVPVIVTDTE